MTLIIKDSNIPPRKSNSTGSLNENDISIDLKEIRGLLGSNQIKFINGTWIRENDRSSINSNYKNGSEEAQLYQRNKKLKEENNLLKLKIDILYHWLTESTADVMMCDNELKQLQQAYKRIHNH